jgi:hypothetical protein
MFDVAEKCIDVSAMAVESHPAYFLRQPPAVDQEDGVLVVNDLLLGLEATDAGRDVDPDPPAAKPSHNSSDLLGADRRRRQDAFGLTEDDELDNGVAATDIEPADEVGTTVASSAGEPAVDVSSATASEHCAGHASGEELELNLPPVEIL